MRSFVSSLLLVPLALSAGCAPASVDDDLSTAAVWNAGKTDAPLPAGNYQFSDGALDRWDFGYLQIVDAWRYVRTTCLDEGCNAYVPLAGRYRFLTTHSGRRYIQFQDGGSNHTGAAPWGTTLDTYAYGVSRGTLRLRRTGTTRWFHMEPIADRALCEDSGALWGTPPQAPANTPPSCLCDKGSFFAPGEGGCVPVPAPSESLCDSTKGSWNDDDSNLLMTFCDCNAYRVWTDGTGCVDPLTGQ